MGYKTGLAPEVIDLSDLEVPALGGRRVKPFVGETVTIETLLDGAEERELADALGSLSRVGEDVKEATARLADAKAALSAARAGGDGEDVAQAQAAVDAAQAAVDAADAAAETSFDMVAAALSVIVHDWTLTDKHGDPIGAPDDPAAWRKLNSASLQALIERIMGTTAQGGETAEQRGKGSRVSRRGA